MRGEELDTEFTILFKSLDKEKRVTVCELKKDGSPGTFLSGLGDKEQGSE